MYPPAVGAYGTETKPGRGDEPGATRRTGVERCDHD